MSATLTTEILRETRLLAYLYPAVMALGIASAFVTTHTSLKIVTSEPRNVPNPPALQSAPPTKVVPEPTILRFGFPDPLELDPFVEPVSELVARSLVPKKDLPTGGGLAPAFRFATTFGVREFFVGPGQSGQQSRSLTLETALAWQTNKSAPFYLLPQAGLDIGLSPTFDPIVGVHLADRRKDGWLFTSPTAMQENLGLSVEPCSMVTAYLASVKFDSGCEMQRTAIGAISTTGAASPTSTTSTTGAASADVRGHR